MSLRRWEIFLAKHGLAIESLSKEYHSRYKLPVKSLLDILIEFAYKNTKQLWYLSVLRNTLLIFLVVLSISLSVIWSEGFDGWEIVFHICASIVLPMFCFINVAFIEAATLDAQRRLLISRVLSLLIRIQGHIDIFDELEFGSNDVHFVPKLDLETDPTNSYAWLFVRLIIQNYGKRALFRMELYLGKIIFNTFSCIALARISFV
jgi:hypothetical protein